MIKALRLVIDANSWNGSGKVFPFSELDSMTHINFPMALLRIGLASVPVGIPHFFLAIRWAQLRYGWMTNGRPILKLRDEADDLDIHYKKLLSDDWGVGFSLEWLSQRFGYTGVHHAGIVLGHLQQLGVAKAKGKATQGQHKSPDFIAVDPGGKFHIIECKGTQTPAHSKQQIQRGIGQKLNIEFADESMVAQRMVASLYIARAKAKQSSCLTISDPPLEENPKRGRYLVAADSSSVIQKAIRASTLAKWAWDSGLYDTPGVAAEQLPKFEAQGKMWTGTEESMPFTEPQPRPGGGKIVGCRIRYGIHPALVPKLRDRGLTAVDIAEEISPQTIEETGKGEGDASVRSAYQGAHNFKFEPYARIRQGDDLFCDFEFLVE
jgi:hypothetical protein